MRPAIFACVNPARFRALSSSSKSANSGSSASYSALASGSESAFSLNFSDVSIFGLLQMLPGFCSFTHQRFLFFFGEVVQ